MAPTRKSEPPPRKSEPPPRKSEPPPRKSEPPPLLPSESESSSEESSSEENEEQDGSESETKEEEDAGAVDKKISSLRKKADPPPHPSSKLLPASSSDESDSDSGSESDSPPSGKPSKADPSIKHLASKPLNDQAAPKKSRSSPSEAPTSPPPAKRPAENQGNGSKRSKRKADSHSQNAVSQMNVSGTPALDDSKKQSSQRLWSEDDEIAVLEGIIDFTAKKKIDPSADFVAFHEFVKDSLQADTSKSQLVTKLRGLKRRFDNYVSKEKEGKELNLSKPNALKAYELSKKIWGSDKNASSIQNDTTTANGTPKKAKKQQASKTDASPVKKEQILQPERAVELEATTNVILEENVSGKVSHFLKGIRASNQDAGAVKDSLQLITGPRRMELQGKWNEIEKEELKIFLKKIELIGEQTKEVLEVMETRNYG